MERTTSPQWLNRYRELVSNGLSQATAIIAPTCWIANEIARLYQLESLPRVVPNGISLSSASSGDRKLQAVTAGRLWDRAKGLDILSSVVSPLPIHVVGEYSAAPSCNFTIFRGHLPHHELLNLFAESAIYLATSLYEPFGLAPLEAARAGCAIVARDIPTFREVWGHAALYFQSPASLELLLHSLVANPRRLKAAQCRASQRASRYTADSMTRQYLALYERLLDSSTRVKEHVLAQA